MGVHTNFFKALYFWFQCILNIMQIIWFTRLITKRLVAPTPDRLLEQMHEFIALEVRTLVPRRRGFRPLEALRGVGKLLVYTFLCPIEETTM